MEEQTNPTSETGSRIPPAAPADVPVPPVSASFPPAPAPRRVLAAGKGELLLAAVMAVLGIAQCNFIIKGGFQLGYAITMPLLILCAALYLIRRGHKLTWYSGGLLGLSILIALGFARSDDPSVKVCLFLLQLAGVNLGLCLLAGQNRRNPASAASLLDAPRALFRMGAGGLFSAGRGLVRGIRDSGTAGRRFGAVGAGLLISLPILVIMISLLTSADAAFEGLLKLLPEADAGECVSSCFWGIALAWLLYSRAVALHQSPKPPVAAAGEKKVSVLTVNTVLTAVCLVYCVYLFSQLAYLSGGLSGILPEEFTMAEYARRGFFEMSRLCMINLSLICVCVWLVKKDNRISLYTRLCGTFLGLITLFLVAAASAKMFMYIGSYGLTWNRVITEVVMLWMALTTVVVVLWLFLPKIPYMKVVFLSAMAIGAAVLWVDVDTVVARYNVEAYRSGKLETVDVDYLDRLSVSAVPYIYRLTTDSDPEVAEQARQALSRKECEIEDFRGWNYARAGALEILEPFQAEEEAAVRNLLKEMTGLAPEGGTLVKRGDYLPRMVEGMRFIRFRFEPEEAEALDILFREQEWIPLQQLQNTALHKVLFSPDQALMKEFRGSYSYSTETQGYWFFRNLHPEAEDPFNADTVVTEDRCRFFFCYYNADNLSLYLYECDRPLVTEEAV